MGLFKKLGDVAKKSAKTAAGAAKNAAIDAAKQVSPKKARKISDKIIGEKNTDRIIDAGEKAHDTVEKTVGKDRLDAAKSGAKSATALAVVGGPKTWAAAAAAGAVSGLVLKKDVIGDVANTLMNGDEEDDKKDPKDPQNEKPETQDKDGENGGPSDPLNQRTDCFPDLSKLDDKAPEPEKPSAEKPEEKPATPTKKPQAAKPKTPKGP